MCGIFGLLNNKSSIHTSIIQQGFEEGNSRGPEDSELNFHSEKMVVGFKRLAINGLTKVSMQPMEIDGITIVCNGEIYNYKELYAMMGIQPTTSSDCEVIIHMYKKYGFDYTIRMLDGVFAIILYDTSNIECDSIVYIARDPFGVRPLYILATEEIYSQDIQSCESIDENLVGFASETKMLMPILGKNGNLAWSKKSFGFDNTNKPHRTDIKQFKISQFTPGTYSKYSKSFLVNSEWTKTEDKTYFQINNTNPFINIEPSLVFRGIVSHLDNAVKKRVIGTTDRPIACLLSGGLDSSLIAALVHKHYIGKKKLQTFSIGMRGSEDIKNAKLVAEHLGTNHTEIILTPEEFLQEIPRVIKCIESYDTTTVRASVGNYLIGKYISNHSDAKVIFNGDGSDEITGGYLYFLDAPDGLAFDCECRRLLDNIHYFDVLRSDRCISSHGLEPRTPFLDKSFVNFYMSLPIELRNPLSSYNNQRCEKYLLRKSFSEEMPGILPETVLWRRKEAFSDGVSGDSGTWFEIIQKKLEETNYIGKYFLVNSKCHNQPKTQEQMYYRDIYNKHYPNTDDNIPYMWMPKFVDADDSSARTLKIYSDITS